MSREPNEDDGIAMGKEEFDMVVEEDTEEHHGSPKNQDPRTMDVRELFTTHTEPSMVEEPNLVVEMRKTMSLGKRLRRKTMRLRKRGKTMLREGLLQELPNLRKRLLRKLLLMGEEEEEILRAPPIHHRSEHVETL